jgi:fructose-1-phosphate kinase PfkB-like protein
VIAELRDEEVDQAAPMFVLLIRHLDEHLGGGGVVLAQVVGEVGVDASVLFLVGDRQGEHLALG